MALILISHKVLEMPRSARAMQACPAIESAGIKCSAQCACIKRRRKAGSKLIEKNASPAAVEEGHPKRAQSAELCVALLVVAERPHQLLYWDGLLIGELVLLGCQPALVDEDVCVRCNQVGCISTLRHQPHRRTRLC